jgi:flavodoxin
MRIVVLFGTTYKTTKRVVDALGEYFKFSYDVFNVADISLPNVAMEYDLFIIFCPTYGDEELQEDMENFLINSEVDLLGKVHIVCETGNYYGYDSFEFGAKKIISHELVTRGSAEYEPGLSLDTLPRISWHVLERWAKDLNEKLAYEQ